MCQTFLPLLRKSGRIVNVSSTGSSLSQYCKEIQQRFRSSKMTLDDLEELMQEYQVRTGFCTPLLYAHRLVGVGQQKHRKPGWLSAAVLQC